AIDPAVSTIRALAVDGNGSVYFTGVAAPGLITGPNAVIPSVPPGTVVAPYLIKLAPGGAATGFATYLSIHGSRPGTRRPRDRWQVGSRTFLWIRDRFPGSSCIAAAF